MPAKDLPIAALGEPPQQLREQIASRAGAVMVGIDIDTGLSRPLEGRELLQWLPIRKANDLSVSLEDEPLVVARSPSMRAAISATVGPSISQLIAVVRTYGR